MDPKPLWGSMTNKKNPESPGVKYVKGGHVQLCDSESTAGPDTLNSDCPTEENDKKKNKYSKDINFAFLTERYEPLREEHEEEEAKAQDLKRKRYRKKAIKVLRSSSKSLVTGLHYVSIGNVVPMSVPVPHVGLTFSCEPHSR